MFESQIEDGDVGTGQEDIEDIDGHKVLAVARRSRHDACANANYAIVLHKKIFALKFFLVLVSFFQM